MKKNISIILYFTLLQVGLLAQPTVDVFNNFEENWLEKWERKSFSRQESEIKVVEEAGNQCLRITSDDSATGIWRELDVEVQPNSSISWKWKTRNTIDNKEEMRKRGDDHVGRIYVIFGKYSFLAQFRVEVICYVWASEKEKGAIFNSPYASNVKLVVLENKDSVVNQWQEEKRNVYEDYKQLFDKAPPVISGIGILADTDNTGGKCQTWFDELVLGSEY